MLSIIIIIFLLPILASFILTSFMLYKFKFNFNLGFIILLLFFCLFFILFGFPFELDPLYDLEDAEQFKNIIYKSFLCDINLNMDSTGNSSSIPTGDTSLPSSDVNTSVNNDGVSTLGSAEAVHAEVDQVKELASNELEKAQDKVDNMVALINNPSVSSETVSKGVDVFVQSAKSHISSAEVMLKDLVLLKSQNPAIDSEGDIEFLHTYLGQIQDSIREVESEINKKN